MMKDLPIDSKEFHSFGDLIGLKFTEVKKGYSQCVIDVNKKLFNPHNVLHGGVLYSMADTGMGGAVYPYLEKGELCATVEIKITYFSAVKSGKVVCDTQVIHKRKKIVILESEIKHNNQLIAKAIGTYSIFKVRNV
ncbi:MAG: PaaI family thioesterase [Candidatus Helarchaeota archaeon]|nr:PaaI family thioesterase [Candidatus Helarchaeota archaeon]